MARVGKVTFKDIFKEVNLTAANYHKVMSEDQNEIQN
jgi:hypothetical protein